MFMSASCAADTLEYFYELEYDSYFLSTSAAQCML
jgi:hypothetical protein